MKQPTLFGEPDDFRGDRASYIEAACSAVAEIARRGEEFSTDAVVEMVGKFPQGKILGNVMLACRRSGLVRPAERWSPSDDSSCNRRPKRFWKRSPK